MTVGFSLDSWKAEREMAPHFSGAEKEEYGLRILCSLRIKTSYSYMKEREKNFGSMDLS